MLINFKSFISSPAGLLRALTERHSPYKGSSLKYNIALDPFSPVVGLFQHGIHFTLSQVMSNTKSFVDIVKFVFSEKLKKASAKPVSKNLVPGLSQLVPTQNSAVAEILLTCILAGVFCHSSLANQPAATISTTIPPITAHSPQNFLDLQCLKSSRFLCQSFSENRSIKSPTNTIAPPIHAEETNRKIDPVVISIYAFLVILPGVIIVAFIFDYRRFKKYNG